MKLDFKYYLSLLFILLTTNISAEILSSSERHNCAVKDDQTISCWGKNDFFGQSSPPSDNNFARVSVGKDHSCALKQDGTMTCWGKDGFGQATAQTGQFFDISSGNVHNCAIKFDKTVICWGNDLLNTGKMDPPSYQFLQVSAGYDHSCGITTTNTIQCWGKNTNGETTTPSGTFSQLSAGDQFSCGIKTDGTLVCWGKNDEDQTSSPSGQFSKVSVGENHACAIRTSDNGITCWGKNNDGKAIAPEGTFREISVGSDHSCAVKENDDSLECWGKDSFKRATPPKGVKVVNPAPEIIIPEICKINIDPPLKHGSISPNETMFECGEEVTFTAQPEGCYSFTGWSGDCSGTDSCTLIMDNDKTISANFEKGNFSLELSAENGQIISDPAKSSYDCDEKVILTAIPDEGYKFVQWEGDITGSTNPFPVTMNNSKNITAIFEPLLVIKPLTVTPSGTEENPLILSLGQDISLTVKGGVPNYNWTITDGELIPNSPSQNKVIYIAPNIAGKQIITVTDTKGTEFKVYVKVINELVCSPHITTIILGDKTPITFRAMGGAEPYRWQVESGTIDPEGAKVNYLAPAQEGDFTVTCKDAQDTSLSSLVRVVKGLHVSPTEKSLAAGESTTLQVVGGQAPFTWVATCGELNRTDGTLVLYTAPKRNGVCEVTVTDALSQAAKVRIQVIGNLIITPIKTVVAIDETVKISAARGTEPYTWSDAKTGRIWTGKFNTIGRHEVVVTDAAGDSGLAVVEVIHNNLGLTPERAFLSRNEILNISVTGGTSPYAWSAEAGTLSSVKGTRVAYIAPDQPGSYNITVRDGRDVQGQVKVIIKADVIELKSGKPRNDMGSINSNIIVDGVERHEKEILVDAASNIEASFSLEMPNDGQQYKVYGAIYWFGLEEQPVLFFKTSTQQALVRYDGKPEFPIYKTAAAGETVVIKDIYNGSLSNYSGHQLMFYVGYAAVGTDVLDGLLFNATQPYNVLVK